jgi:hypothetical protein
MSKSDLRARPIYHHKRESIEAHLTIVFAALAVTRWLERRTDWSIKKLITSLRRYHTIEISRRPDRHRRRPATRRHPHHPATAPPSRGAH